jgi:hypothetical protein
LAISRISTEDTSVLGLGLLPFQETKSLSLTSTAWKCLTRNESQTRRRRRTTPPLRRSLSPPARRRNAAPLPLRPEVSDPFLDGTDFHVARFGVFLVLDLTWTYFPLPSPSMRSICAGYFAIHPVFRRRATNPTPSNPSINPCMV